MFNIVKDDLIKFVIKNKTNVAHGCNCFNTMGAGVALSVRQMWPEMFYADSATLKGSTTKLGSYSWAKIGTNQYGFNLYTQYNYGKGSLFQVEHLESSLYAAMKAIATSTVAVKHLAVPFIGSGLGRGDPCVIEKTMRKIASEIPEVDLTLVIL